MALIFKELHRTLDSDSNYLRNKETGDVFEGGLFLGIHDIPENYEEISKEEYENYLKLKEEAEREQVEADLQEHIEAAENASNEE